MERNYLPVHVVPLKHWTRKKMLVTRTGILLMEADSSSRRWYLEEDVLDHAASEPKIASFTSDGTLAPGRSMRGLCPWDARE